MQNYVYGGKFSGNILIVGRIGCGKTYFTQKLAINRCFAFCSVKKRSTGYRI